MEAVPADIRHRTLRQVQSYVQRGSPRASEADIYGHEIPAYEPYALQLFREFTGHVQKHIDTKVRIVRTRDVSKGLELENHRICWSCLFQWFLDLGHQSSPLCTFYVGIVLQYLPGLVETDRFRILIGLYAV